MVSDTAGFKKTELRQQAKGLRKVHLRDCLIDAQTKKQHNHVRDIKQTINQEESKRMWYLIKRTVKDPHSPIVLKVQRVLCGEPKEYSIQEDVENENSKGIQNQISPGSQRPNHVDSTRGLSQIPTSQNQKVAL